MTNKYQWPVIKWSKSLTQLQKWKMAALIGGRIGELLQLRAESADLRKPKEDSGRTREAERNTSVIHA